MSVEDLPLDGRVAVVTGAASGIGAATARRLARDGARVWLADLALEAARTVAEEIASAGGQAEAVQVDVADEDSVRRALVTVSERDPAVDVLVAGAGIITIDRFEDFSVASWERVLRINVIGTYLTLSAALPLLRAAAAPARAIIVASAAGKRPGPFTAPYNASKAATLSIMRTAAVSWAPDVLVNAISPGVIATPMWERMDKELAALGAGPETSFEARSAAVPIGRPGSAEEVADVVSFVAGPGGRYLVGEELNVNGGLTVS